MLSKILRLVVNTLTADDKYSRSNMQKLQQQFQSTLYQKQKTFWLFFIEILEPAWNLEHFPKKDEYHSLSISQIIDSEKRGFLNV